MARVDSIVLAFHWPYVIWVLVTLIGLALVCGVIIIVDAWLEVRSQPREEMFICDKHGTIRKAHLIEFMGYPYCPMCFHEKMEKAERIDK